IIGCEVYIAPGSRLDKKKGFGGKTAYHLTLLAKNDIGYRNLCKLTSIGFLEGFYYNPRIDWESLQKHAEGLICLSGCMGSEISQTILNASEQEAREKIEKTRALFGEDFYLEVQRHAMTPEQLEEDGFHKESWLITDYQNTIAKQKQIEEAFVRFSKELSIPLVATNDSHYIHREDWKSHEILLNIQSGEPCEIWELDSLGNPKFRKPNPKRRTYPSHEFYFKSPQEMRALFADLPEACDNTLLIAEKCCMEMDFKTKHYPLYTPPKLEGKTVSKEEREKVVEEFLRALCEEGIPNRYTPERLAKVKEHFPDREPMDVVRERLEMEMSIIAPKGMCDYLLIVWDFINWAKSNGIPVGPGRGSGAGSIVLYLIGITDIEPLRFHLFFERFINPERLSYPDIDVDICMWGRPDVINYTLNKYGRENVAQIITFGTMKAKMTIKDVGRVLNIPLSKVNQICKLVPEDLNITLEGALEKDPDLSKMAAEDEETARIFEIGKTLEGCIRNTGIHAAGLVVAGEPLTEYIPICNAKDSDIPATQFAMKPVEQVGMLKIDFLGLKTLTSIKICVDAIKASRGLDVDWVNLPLDDKPTFEVFNQGKTMGVFQLESTGMQELSRNLHLDRFEEIIAVLALYRPGPMDMIPSFIARKHGQEAIENDHPLMQEILAETYGIMVYQEQVMQIAQKLAGYSLGEGDVLRRAMGKKDHDEMQRQRTKFVEGCVENAIDRQTATLIFDKMEKFASYGFNKSHAAAYGYVSYVTAYLKANFPAEWMAALMTCDRDDTAKVAKFIREARAMGIAVLPPDVNEASNTFAATESGIRFAISAIKGVGEGVVEAILEERSRTGKFKSLYDFVKRIDTRKVGKKVIENLIDAGCFDFTGWSRDALKIAAPQMYDVSQRKQKDESLGYMSLFTQLGDENEALFVEPPAVPRPTASHELLLKEKELLGFFLTGHPMDAYKPILQRLSCVSLSRVEEMSDKEIFRSALLVETVAVRFSNKSQRKFAILNVSDGLVTYELPIWPELYEEKAELLNENALLYAVLMVEKNGSDVKLSCKWVGDLAKADEAMIAECDTAFDKAKHQAQRFAQMKDRPRKEPKEEKPKVITHFTLKVDAEKARMSEMLKLKEIFEESRGATPVKLEFVAGG
ncbi:MAG: DNA polymerase III subunit alpha, partial [Chlamydiia bacterium]|nr:DNA polymerase III subunit alpha [Chlamydiia bacterium]